LPLTLSLCLFNPFVNQVLGEDVRECEVQIEHLNDRCSKLDADDETRIAIEPRLLQLNNRWQHLKVQFKQFKKPSEPNEEDQLEPAVASTSSSAITREAEKRTLTTVITMVTTEVTSLSFTRTNFATNVNKLLDIIQQLGQYLQSEQFSAKVYEEFSLHEDNLKVNIGDSKLGLPHHISYTSSHYLVQTGEF